MCHVIYECPLGVRGWCMSAAHEDRRNQGARGPIPSISPDLQAKRRPSKGLELPHPPNFQTFLRPFSWLSSISWELLRCPTHHISTMVISHKLSSRELALQSTSSTRHSELTLDQRWLFTMLLIRALQFEIQYDDWIYWQRSSLAHDYIMRSS